MKFNKDTINKKLKNKLNGRKFMKLKNSTLIIIFCLVVIIFSGCSEESTKISDTSKKDSAQTVVEKFFQYKNEKNKKKILTTLTDHWNAPNMVWGFENLDSIKIISIEEEKSDSVRKGYLSNGRGSVNNTTEENLKVYKVKYDVKYKKDGIGPQDSGIYDWWEFVIRKDENSPWLIDDMGV